MADTIRHSRDDDGVVTLVLDDPNQSANTMNADFIASFHAVVDRLVARRDEVAGVIITSAKKTFFAGGDLNDLRGVGPDDAEAFRSGIEGLKADMRRLETLGKPVVAAVGGAALGGGLEPASWPTTASWSTTRGSSSASPRSSSGCCPVPAASCGPCGCSGSSMR